MASTQDLRRAGRGADEQTPLLTSDLDGVETDTSTLVDGSSPSIPVGASTADPVRDDDDDDDDAGKPMPKWQILLLCYARAVEPLSFFTIFPYIAAMVQDNGNLPESDVGFYSGLIESLFSATQVLVLVFWGRLADRVGRRPVLIWSLVGTTVTPALFGVSRSIPQMILFRCLAGVFSGTTLIIRTMISELTGPETQATAFSWFAVSANMGLLLGPLLGGALAKPTEQYNWNNEFLRNYPYALPGFVTAAISLTAVVLCALFLEETLDVKKPAAPSPTAPSAEAAPDSSDSPENLSLWELLRWPGVGIVVFTTTIVMFIAFAFTALMPVYLYTDVALGGVGFSPSQISLYMALQGASQALWVLLVFPMLQWRIGTKGVLRLCAYVSPWFYASYMLLNSLLRDGSHVARIFFWIIGGFWGVVGPGVSMAFTGVQLAVNDVSPTPHVLGTLNAVVMTASAAIRSVDPALSTTVFAIGVRNQILNGQLMWAVLIVISLGTIFICAWLPESEIPAARKKKKLAERRQEEQ